jgi:hypothetical protein
LNKPTWTTGKINAVQSLKDATAEKLRSRFPNIYSQQLVEIFFAQPHCQIADLVDVGIV